MNEKNIKMNGDNIVIGNFAETNETAIHEFNLRDYTWAIERFHRLGVEVQHAGFNMLSQFTVITSDHFNQITWGPMSVDVPASMLGDFYDKITHFLGDQLIMKIIRITEKGGQFSQNKDLNKKIDADEMLKRGKRLMGFMTKLGYEKEFHSFEWERFEAKFPRFYLDYMIRAILEGGTGVLKCASCTHATFIEGGFLICDEKQMQEVDTSDGIPSRLNHATAQRVWFGKIDSNVISKPEEMHDCWKYCRSTKEAAIKKVTKNNKK